MSSELSQSPSVWSQEALLTKANSLNWGTTADRLRELSDEPAMKAQLAILALGRIMSERADDTSLGLISEVHEFAFAAAQQALDASGYTELEMATILTVATQAPPSEA